MHRQRSQRAAVSIHATPMDHRRPDAQECSKLVPALNARVEIAPRGVSRCRKVRFAFGTAPGGPGQFWRVDIGEAYTLAVAKADGVTVVDGCDAKADGS